MKIKKQILEDILQVAKSFHPRETGGILLGKEQIDDYVLIPGEFNLNSVRVKLNQVPIYVNKQGTFHSHPTPSANPSNADRKFFSKMGKYHLIIAKPYTQESVKAYNNRGEKIDIEVTEDE